MDANPTKFLTKNTKILAPSKHSKPDISEEEKNKEWWRWVGEMGPFFEWKFAIVGFWKHDHLQN